MKKFVSGKVFLSSLHSPISLKLWFSVVLVPQFTDGYLFLSFFLSFFWLLLMPKFSCSKCVDVSWVAMTSVLGNTNNTEHACFARKKNRAGDPLS